MTTQQQQHTGDSEESGDDKVEPQIPQPNKRHEELVIEAKQSVAFDLPQTVPTLPCTMPTTPRSTQADTENPTSQNDEADARLVHAAWLRKMSENVYMSNRKAMSLRTYVQRRT